ncbi:MAG: T9SS type A sorting domain-containing protein [Bacteroidales bacterium]|nr:T9SS type A sorting domain-containing protein [Bacteroidales bacterium]
MKISRLYIKSIIGILSFSFTLNANVFYVAPTGGSDFNPGTINKPWATWQKAFNTAQAGDTVYFRGGIWYPTEVLKINPKSGIGNNGSPGNPVCYFAYPGETPVLDFKNAYAPPPNPHGPGNRYLTGIDLVDAHWIYFKGLTVRNVYQRDENVNARAIIGTPVSNMTFENVTVHNIGGAGFYMNGVVGVQGHNYGWDSGLGYVPYDTVRYINCDAYQCCDSLPANVGNDPGNMGDGFKHMNYAIGYVSYEGCRAWHCSDDGFDNAMKNVINCWSFDHAYPGYNFEGNGFKPGVAGNETVVFKNNLIAFCSGHGIQPVVYGTFTGGYRLYNNTIYRSAVGISVTNYSYKAIDIIFRNNIIYDMTKRDAGGRPYIHDYNYPHIESNNTWIYAASGSLPDWTYHPTMTVTNNDFVTVSKDVAMAQLTAPRKPDGSLPDVTFLKPKAGSQLIDAGTQIPAEDNSGVILDYYGSAPDIGYAEYNSGSVPPTEPKFQTAVIENITPSRLEMTYSLPLANITPATSAFSVRVNSIARAVNSVTVSGTKVTLALASPVSFGDVVTLTYSKPPINPLQTSSGGQAASLTAQNITNNVAAPIPEYLSSVIENTTPARLDITYSLALANIIPATSAFTVRINNAPRAISSVSVSGTKVFLTLTSPVVYDDAVTVAYNKLPGNPLQTTAGGQVTTMTAQNVLNNCRMPANQPPVANISSPAKSNTFTAPATINIEATANDPDGTIIKIEFYNGEVKLGEVLNKPYSFTWKDVAEGTYFISVAATDNKNTRAVSDPVLVIVNAEAIDTLGTISQTSEIEFSMLDTKIPGFEIINLYPNPSDGHFSVDMSGIAEDDRRFTIYNLSGQAVVNEKKSSHETSIDFNHPELPAGIYILTVSLRNKTTDSRTIIKR